MNHLGAFAARAIEIHSTYAPFSSAAPSVQHDRLRNHD
jgi:hypothetical protein